MTDADKDEIYATLDRLREYAQGTCTVMEYDQ